MNEKAFRRSVTAATEDGRAAAQPYPLAKGIAIARRKVMQGKARVLPPPGGVPGPCAQRHEPFTAKLLIFNHFTHVPTA